MSTLAPEGIDTGEMARPIESARPVVLLDKAEAEVLTAKIKSYAGVICQLLRQAHDQQAWRAMGYKSWTEYVRTEFDMSRSRAYQLVTYAAVVEHLALAADLEVSTVVDTFAEGAVRGIDPAAIEEALTEAFMGLPANPTTAVKMTAVQAAMAALRVPAKPKVEGQPEPEVEVAPVPVKHTETTTTKITTEFSSDGPPTTDEATGEGAGVVQSPAVAPGGASSVDAQVPAPAASTDSDGEEAVPSAPTAASTGDTEGETNAAPQPVPGPVPGADLSDAATTAGATSVDGPVADPTPATGPDAFGTVYVVTQFDGMGCPVRVVSVWESEAEARAEFTGDDFTVHAVPFMAALIVADVAR